MEPLRGPHREKMARRSEEALSVWMGVKASLEPLVRNFELESLQLLGTVRVRAFEALGEGLGVSLELARGPGIE